MFIGAFIGFSVGFMFGAFILAPLTDGGPYAIFVGFGTATLGAPLGAVVGVIWLARYGRR